MINTQEKNEEIKYEMICVIANINMGSKIAKVARKAGINGSTIKLGRGTAKSTWLDFFELSDIRKEIVYLIADSTTVSKAMDALMREFHFEKPNHGIAYILPLYKVEGIRGISNDETFKEETNEEGDEKYMHHIITVIVDKGLAENVMDAAEAAGAKGGTIMNARGAGIHETSRLFMMDVEPEKEVVMIISESDQTKAIVESIKKDIKIDEPGNGILYVQNVAKTYGLQK